MRSLQNYQYFLSVVVYFSKSPLLFTLRTATAKSHDRLCVTTDPNLGVESFGASAVDMASNSGTADAITPANLAEGIVQIIKTILSAIRASEDMGPMSAKKNFMFVC